MAEETFFSSETLIAKVNIITDISVLGKSKSINIEMSEIFQVFHQNGKRPPHTHPTRPPSMKQNMHLRSIQII